MKTIIKTHNLCKSYDTRQILNSINFEVKQGEIIGLLGGNGIGKTTLLKLLCGLLEPTEGEIEVCGNSPWDSREKVLKRVGVMIETPVFYEHLTAHQNLKIHLQYLDKKSDKDYINEILKVVGLDNVDNKPVSKFSMGMKQKLGIARAISHNPEVLLLDEPINGLDPIAIKDIRELLIKLKQTGMTIVLSSHILGEILQTVLSVVVIANGKLNYLGEIKELKNRYGDKVEDYLIERMRG